MSGMRERLSESTRKLTAAAVSKDKANQPKGNVKTEFKFTDRQAQRNTENESEASCKDRHQSRNAELS